MIHQLASPKTTKKAKIIGRGIGSGKGGHNSTRGTKGQKSRSGYTRPRPDFEGGQNPISKRLPKLKGPTSNDGRKRGFITSKQIRKPIHLSDLELVVSNGDTITLEKLFELKLLKPKSHKDYVIKVLFDKDIEKSITIEGIPVSESARKSIEKAGGSVK